MPSRSTQGLSTLLMRSATLGGDLSAARCAIPARPWSMAAAHSFRTAAEAAPQGHRSASVAHAPAAAPPPDGSSPLGSSPLVLFDVETTGLRPAHNRIVSIAASCRGLEYSQIVNPQRPLRPKNRAIHGLVYDHHVRDMPTWAAVSPIFWARLLEWAGPSAMLVGHNGESLSCPRAAPMHSCGSPCAAAAPDVTPHAPASLSARQPSSSMSKSSAPRTRGLRRRHSARGTSQWTRCQ